VNELLDSIEMVVVGAARRRARRRHRVRVTLVATLGLLVLASAASAVTGTGPIGAALNSDPVLPDGAQRHGGGPTVEIGVTARDGRDWELHLYRKSRGGPLGERGTPDGHDYCLAAVRETPRGGRRWRGVSCGSSMEIALDLRKDGLLTHCGAGGVLDGRPQPMGPVCGLVPVSATAVEVTPEGHPTQQARLSEPFALTIDRAGRPLRHHRIPPARMRGVPARLRVRAFLAIPDVPPTRPGSTEPGLAIVARGPAGWTRTERRKGLPVMTPAQTPQIPMTPPPGAPTVTVAASAGGGTWTVTGFASPPGPGLPNGTVCQTAKHSSHRRGPAALACVGPESRVEGLARYGIGDTGSGARTFPLRGNVYAVFGFVRADARALTVRDRGKSASAHFSKETLKIGRMRARAFVALLRGKPDPIPERRVGFAVELPDGRVIRSAPPERR
jgi:hypothetical protein